MDVVFPKTRFLDRRFGAHSPLKLAREEIRTKVINGL
jgi:hypothetical protein